MHRLSRFFALQESTSYKAKKRSPKVCTHSILLNEVRVFVKQRTEQMRKMSCYKKHATCIWHTKGNKSLMIGGFRALKWTYPLCSFARTMPVRILQHND